MRLPAHDLRNQPVPFPRLDPINRFLAISEVLGHLDWLEEQGRVKGQMKGVVRLWRAA